MWYIYNNTPNIFLFIVYDVRFVTTPICFVEVHVLFVICNYLHMLVSNTFSISDDVCVISCNMTCMTSGAGITWVHLGFKLCLSSHTRYITVKLRAPQAQLKTEVNPCDSCSISHTRYMSFCLFFFSWPLHCLSWLPLFGIQTFLAL
jgi:hypothetical protein